MSGRASSRYPKRRAEVLGTSMAYVEAGRGDPVVFLHGNPASSYLWRNVIPHLEGTGRCLAPDLIGMGDSAKLPPGDPDRYSFAAQARYLDALLDALGVRGNVTLVLHDWGSALGFDWARRHPGTVTGIAYLEPIAKPLSWARLPGQLQQLFRALRSPAGEQMVLQDNLFVEQILPGGILRQLSEAELAEYRQPYLAPGEDRRPTLTWPRQIPIDGQPADVTQVVTEYSAWLEHEPLPKLLIAGQPGAVLRGELLDYCRSWPRQAEVTVNGLHFLPEDSPDEIGAAVAAWRAGLA